MYFGAKKIVGKIMKNPENVDAMANFTKLYSYIMEMTC